MVEKINWSLKYNVGIAEIDYQHKYFLKLINRLALNHEFLKENGLIPAHLSELDKYARFHFKSEENIMNLVCYTDMKCHAQLHIDLIDQLNYQSYEVTNSTKNMNEFIIFLKEWFLTHTVNQDKKLSEYIKKVDRDFSCFFDK